MTDERLGTQIGAWLRDAAPWPGNPSGSVARAMATVRQTPQRKRPPSLAFVARGSAPISLAGPNPGAPRHATNGHAPALATRQTRGSNKMLLATLASVATVIILGGSFLLQGGVIETAPAATVPVASPGPAVTPEVPSAVHDVVRDDRFELSVTTPKDIWTVGEPVQMSAALAYIGAEPETVVTGGPALVAFGIEQLDGPVDQDPFWRASCGQFPFATGDVQTFPFVKSGSFDADDPMAAFWKDWFDDPQLRPPAGEYRLFAEARYGWPDCGDGHTLTAAVDLEVVEPPAPDAIRATSDLKAIAKAQGWTIEEAKADQMANRALDRVVGEIADEHREIYIGGALSEAPGGTPSVFIKGPAPQPVRDLVAAADYPIAIVDDQPYSREELVERKDRVHRALVDAGYLNVATGVDIAGGGIIPVSVLQGPGLPTDPAGVLEFVPEELRADVDLQVTAAPPRPSTEPGEWGPLAVLYRPGGFGAGVGLGPVTLRIGEKCVWIESKRGKQRTTLVWEGDHVDWRPNNRRIVFTDRRGETVRLSDGDRITGGGVNLWPQQGPEGSSRATPEPEAGRRWAPELDDAWLHAPDPSCPSSLFYLDEAAVE